MPTSLGRYFNGLADVIATRAVLGGDATENIDIGTNREVICREFLEKHLPPRFLITLGGDVFGLNNKRSGQIDIVINHDMSMTFRENNKPRCPVESVTAAISVKSRLTKAELISALENLATIPQPHLPVISLSPLSKPPAEYILSWPALFVFAFSGLSADTCRQHLVEFYMANSVPLNRIRRAIVVNRSFILTFCAYSIPGATLSMPFSQDYLRGSTVIESTRGHPLFWMMHELSKGLSWLSGLYLDYASYYEEAFRLNVDEPV